MKVRVWVLVAVAVAALSSLGCVCSGITLPVGVARGSGKVVSEEREIGNVTEVDLQGVGNVHIELGERTGLRIEAEDNLLRYIETEVDEGRLEIKHRRGTRLLNTMPIDYFITVRTLDAVSVSGAGNIDVSQVRTERFQVRLGGAGNVQIQDLEAGTLDVTISGAGGLVIEDGQVDDQEVVISGAGDYNARGMNSRECTVRLSGMGSATVQASEHLDVTISGAGSVQYLGDAEVEQQVTGVGRVRQIGE